MREVIEKAAVLHEALPYIRRFRGRRFVVKYGGNAMIDPELRQSFARDIVVMKYVGIDVIVVHGGGPQIDAELEVLGVESERIDGLRVTDDRTMEVVEMVLGGRINNEIVSLINQYGGRAVGLTGHDDGLVRAIKVDEMRTKSGKLVDPGRVGAVREVRTEMLLNLVEAGCIPVIAPVAVDVEGRSLNINADTVAGAVASAVQAEKLVLMTDTTGVLDKEGKLITSLTADDVRRLISDDTIAGGMIPKVECAVESVRTGTKKAHIVDGRVQHALLLEVFTDQGVGSEIRTFGRPR